MYNKARWQTPTLETVGIALETEPVAGIVAEESGQT